MLPLMLSTALLATPVPEEPQASLAWVRLSAESVAMPQAGERLGLVGFTFGAVDDGLYVAPALYGAVRGERGGLLVLGFEGGWRKPLSDSLHLQTGLFLGGGGGGAAPVGSGLMTRFQLGLDLDLDPHTRIGAGVSDLRWPGGGIHGRQLALTLERRFQVFRKVAFAELPGTWDLHEHAFEWTFQRREQNGGLPRLAPGERKREALGLAGVSWTRSAGAWGLWTAEAAAAASGQAGGYMEVLAGGGLRAPLGERFEVRATLEAGSGGGGGLDTGGGFLLKGAVDLRILLTPRFTAAVSYGQLRAPSTALKATSLGLKAGFRGSFAAPGTRHSEGPLVSQPWRLRPSWTHLTTSRRTDPAQDGRAFDLVGLQGDWILQEHIYLLGQGAFAFTNEAGAYATGLLGVGFQTSPRSGHRLVAEVRAGAGGGAGMKTAGGALLQPMAGWLWEGPGAWGVQLLGGRAKSLKGSFSSPVLEAGLVFRGGSLRVP